MSFELQLAAGVLLPLLITVGVLIPALLIPRDSRFRGKAVGTLGALGITCGYLAGHVFVRGIPPVFPVEVEDWIPILLVAALATGIVDVCLRLPWLVRALIRVGQTVLMVGLLTRPLVVNSWSTQTAALWISGLSLAMLGIWWAVDRVARRDTSALPLFVLGLVVAGLTVVQGISSSLVLARLTGALAITIAPLALLAVRQNGETLLRASLPVIVVGFGGLLTCGYFFSEVPWSSAILVGLAPVTLGFGLLSWRKLGRRVGVGLCLLVVVGMIGGAVGIAVVNSPAEPEASEEY